MAEDKKGFLCYADWLHTIKKLPDETAGKLFKHILMYVNDQNPVTDDLMVEVTFEPIKQTFKRDLIAWEKKREGYSLAGKASAEARKKYKKELDEKHGVLNQQRSTTLNDVERRSKEKATKPDIPEIDWPKLLAYINKSFGREFKLINDKVKKSFMARLKEGYKKEDILRCIDNLVNVSHHKENGYQYVTPEFISRSDTMTKYSTKTTTTLVQSQISLGTR